MKFLQIHNTPNNQPRILEMGKNFNRIESLNNDIYKGIYLQLAEYTTTIVTRLEDCYQSRPLIEIDGFCEFDIILNNKSHEARMIVSGRSEEYYTIDIFYSFENHDESENKAWIKGINGWYKSDVDESLGSIFTPKNILKYPELYKQALEIVNQN